MPICDTNETHQSSFQSSHSYICSFLNRKKKFFLCSQFKFDLISIESDIMYMYYRIKR